MQLDISSDQLQLYKSLFKAREDVFAKRREANGKSGYMPAYNFDRDVYMAHRAKGGTMSTFEAKTLKPISEYSIKQHLIGKETLGVYPLLTDNTSRWIAVDFDEADYKQDALAFQQLLQQHSIPSYLEISRSGNGCHLWVFFMEAYPAHKSRKIFLSYIEQIYTLSPFTHQKSFDRLFPNQDYHSHKGFWNLIALPLQGTNVAEGKSVFVDSNFVPYTEQRQFLSTIQRVETKILDECYTIACNESTTIQDTIPVQKTSLLPVFWSDQTVTLEIVLAKVITLQKSQLNPVLIKFLKEQLNFINSEYLTKKRMHKSVYNTEQYFNCITDHEHTITLPRGFLFSLQEFCSKEEIAYSTNDETKNIPCPQYKRANSLYEYQQQAVQSIIQSQQGVLVAPPWTGKTVMGLATIAHHQQTTLIILHRQQLVDQWIERIGTFLNIPKRDIGTIKTGKIHIGKQITIAMMQTLIKLPETELKSLENTFWLILIDEAHHIPAKTFRETIKQFNPHFLYGLTATPKRKHNDEALIYAHIWPILHTVEIQTNAHIHHQIKIIETSLQVPFATSIDQSAILSKIISFDTHRNNLICEHIFQELHQHKRILILSERKEHLEVLSHYLNGRCEYIILSWDDGQKLRDMKAIQIKNHQFQVILATGQLIGEGRDINCIDTLMLIYPFSFEGKLIQYIGRLQRSSWSTTIYDFHDTHIAYYNTLFKKRLKYYKTLTKQWYNLIEGNSLFA
jgi:superfamily II DNA or RNA helicase